MNRYNIEEIIYGSVWAATYMRDGTATDCVHNAEWAVEAFGMSIEQEVAKARPVKRPAKKRSRK